MKSKHNILLENTRTQIELYVLDAQSILGAKNSDDLASCIENSQTGISEVYENGIDEIKSRLKEAGLKTNFDEQQNFVLSQYIGFNLQTIVFDEFFLSIEGEDYSLEKIPNLLEGGEQGDELVKCARFIKFIGLVGKSMFAVSNVAASTDITPMDSFIADLNESTIIGHSWDSPLIGVFPPKDAAFFTKLYSTKDWKKKFHQRCVNVGNEMISNTQNLNLIN
jgi:hypothetical protein